METQTRTTHPMILFAAASVALLSLTGVASLAGWLPGQSAAAPPAAEIAAAPASTATPDAIPAAVEKPAVASAPAGSRVAAQASQEPVPRPSTKQPSSHKPAPLASEQPAPASLPPSYDRGGTTRVANTAEQDSGIYVESRKNDLCRDCGTIESVREIKQEGEGSGIGAVAGGVIGGLLGNQIGGGRGRSVATVAGVVGGAYAGHQVEKKVRVTPQYQVTVRRDDGSVTTLTETQAPAWQTGDRVRISNGQITGM